MKDYDEIFDNQYTEDTPKISTTPSKSEMKILLKEAIKDESIEKYGKSKPVRIVIKAKITND